ncbi:MAG: hypothetical protein ACRENG_12320, partial [bacterium]
NYLADQPTGNENKKLISVGFPLPHTHRWEMNGSPNGLPINFVTIQCITVQTLILTLLVGAFEK